MKWTLLALAAFAAACSGGERPANAVGDTSAMATPDTTPPLAAPAADTTKSLDDAGILLQVARADAAEIGGARYMRAQTSNASVRTLATRLATDHAANLRQVTDAAATLNVTLPAVDTATAAPAGLQGLSGAAADSAWVQQEIADHTETIDTLQHMLLPAAASPSVKALLQTTIPVLKAHLAAAQAAQKHVGH